MRVKNEKKLSLVCFIAKSQTFNHLYFLQNGVENEIYYQHQKSPTCAKYSTSGFYICSGDATGNVRIWDTTQKEHILKVRSFLALI